MHTANRSYKQRRLSPRTLYIYVRRNTVHTSALSSQEYSGNSTQNFSHLSTETSESLRDHVKFFDRLSVELGVKRFEDWYKVPSFRVRYAIRHRIPKDFCDLNLFKREYDNCLWKALEHVYPFVEWIPWHFKQRSSDYWKDYEHHVTFFEWLSKELDIAKPQDWYQVKAQKVREKGGSVLLDRYYNSSLFDALSKIYPNYKWKIWKFQPMPVAFWRDLHNQREFFDWFAEEHSFDSKESWYTVTAEEIQRHGGDKILDLYSGVLLHALKAVYPETKWLFWRFKEYPSSLWNSAKNRRLYFDWLATELEIREYSDWYSKSEADVESRYGKYMLQTFYEGVLATALLAVYPEYSHWKIWRFLSLPATYWNHPQHHLIAFEALAKQLHVTRAEDWYHVTVSDIYEPAVLQLLHHFYNNSVCTAILQLYPQHKLLFWKFKQVPKEYWAIPENQRQFLEHLASKYSLHSSSDWSRVTAAVVLEEGGAGLLDVYQGSLYKALSALYPQLHWQLWNFEEASYSAAVWSPTTERQFFDWLAVQLKIKTFEEWYQLKSSHIVERGAGSLLQKYNSSLCAALQSVYSCYTWQGWKFTHDSQSFWSKVSNHREYLDWLTETLDISSTDDVYRMTAAEFTAHGGAELLKQYNSLYEMMTHVYPEFRWQAWLFGRVPDNYWQSITHRRDYFEWLMTQLDIRSAEDWYRVKPHDVRACHGSTVLQLYNGSLYTALKELLPDTQLHFWRFSHTHLSSFRDVLSQRQLLDDVAQRLQLRDSCDWYQVNLLQESEKWEKILFHCYGGSAFSAFRSIYPEFDWLPWKLDKQPEEFWTQLANQQQVFQHIQTELNIHSLDDWYAVDTLQLRQMTGASEILRCYSGELHVALQSIYPEHEWILWRFSTLPHDALLSLQQHQLATQWIASQLKVKCMEDWYNITPQMFMAVGAVGKELLHRYELSLYKLLSAVYSDYPWQSWRFSVEHSQPVTLRHRKVFDAVSKQLNIKDMDDWYSVSALEVKKTRASKLLEYYYNGSLIKALLHLYPHHNWQIWRFEYVPKGYWNSADNIREYFDWLSIKLNIKSLDDWNRVSIEDIRRLGGATLLFKNATLQNILSRLYPHHSFHSNAVKYKIQRSLFDTLQDVFPRVDIFMNYQKTSDLQFAASNRAMQLDIFIPSMSLAFEYQGEQHFQDHMIWGSAAVPQQRDSEKKQQCQLHGITLIEIPYWWDKSRESLLATIHLHRPDIPLPHLPPNTLPIPPHPPTEQNSELPFTFQLSLAHQWNM